MLNKTDNRSIHTQIPISEKVDANAARSWLDPISNLAEVDIHYDSSEKTLWQFMNPVGRPSFTPGLISDCTKVLDAVEQAHRTLPEAPVDYLVIGSRMPGTFNLGGDLTRFQQMILAGDRASLRHYAHSCVKSQYRCSIKMNLPICTIALVQGDALGGGFEVALSHEVIIAERGAKFGLPEILFNLFPGMGAYSFLSRRLDSARAQRLMTSGQLYTAEEMFAMGIVDVVAEDGDGEAAVLRFTDQHRRTRKAHLAVGRLRQLASPLSLQEMLDIADLWVETALTLEARDLRKMRHLVAAQERRLPALSKPTKERVPA